MKKSLLTLAILGAFSSAAMAQSNVTIYGEIDAAVRSINNADAAGGRQISLGGGLFENSRLGFKGTEDIGSGTSAVFDLEAGFGSTNGALDQQGQLFGNQAWVGLKNNAWGEVDLGRQYGLAYQTLGTYGALGRGVYTEQGNAPEVSWQQSLFGVSFDNSIEYSNNFGPVKVQGQYSSGGVAGSPSAGSTGGVAVSYATGPFAIGGVYQQSKDTLSNDLSVWGLGGSYVAGPATLYLSYFDAKRDPGFGTAINQNGLPLSNSTLMANTNTVLKRDDDVWSTGVVFQATPALAYTLGYMHDEVHNDSDLGDRGRLYTVYGVVDYNLSKRTDVYFELDHTSLGGGEVASNDVLSVPGGSQRTGVSAGMRLKF